MNKVDILVIIIISILCVAIATYLFFAYYKSPCGTCSEAKRCSRIKKSKPNWVKNYNKCYGRINIENIFLDFNGTILDDLELSYDLLCELAQIYDVEKISKKRYLELFDFPVKDYYEKAGFDFTKVNFNEAADYFISNYSKRWPKETKIFDNFVKVITKLKKEGLKIYIITASEEKLLLSQLEHFGILNLFDGYVASKDNKAKGKIEYAKDFILDNNINPKKSIMIGDTTHDYEVAKAINMRCALFLKGHNSKKRLKETKCKLLKSYNDLYKYIQNIK